MNESHPQPPTEGAGRSLSRPAHRAGPARHGYPTTTLTMTAARTHDHTRTLTAQLREGTFAALAPARLRILRAGTPPMLRHDLRNGTDILLFLGAAVAAFTAGITLLALPVLTSVFISLATGSALLQAALTVHERLRRRYEMPVQRNRVAASFLYRMSLVEADVRNAVRSNVPTAADVLKDLRSIRPVYEKLVVDLVEMAELEQTGDLPTHHAAKAERLHGQERLTQILAEAYAAADIVAMRAGRFEPTLGAPADATPSPTDASDLLPDSHLSLDDHQKLSSARKRLRVDTERLDA